MAANPSFSGLWTFLFAPDGTGRRERRNFRRDLGQGAGELEVGAAIDCADGSGTLLFELTRRDWSTEVVNDSTSTTTSTSQSRRALTPSGPHSSLSWYPSWLNTPASVSDS